MKAIVHCQGSTSFCMSAVAGLLPEVDVIVSNAVSLHPVIPAFARFKIGVLRPMMAPLTPYLNPAWGDGPDTAFSRVARGVVMATHRECDNPVCRMVSFTYGSGRPALWSHENLNEETHDWLRGEFAEVPMSFFAQMDACVKAGQLVAVSKRPGLLERYADERPADDRPLRPVRRGAEPVFPARKPAADLRLPGRDTVLVSIRCTCCPGTATSTCSSARTPPATCSP